MVELPLIDQISSIFTYNVQTNSLGQLVSNSIELILIVAIIIALLFLLIGAINWITAEGKPDKLEGARNTILHAIVGLVLAVAAYLIWVLIVQQFLGITNLTGGTTPGTGGGGAGAGGSCTPSSSDYNDGGAGGYCDPGPHGGAAYVRCNRADGHLNYPHFDPCFCLDSGTERTIYNFTSC